MSFVKKKTGEFKTIEVEKVLVLCDICRAEMTDVYPNFSVEVSKYLPVVYEDDDDVEWFHDVCSANCLRKIADRFENGK